ncbi:hypothetical protein Bbelb_085060 [Branchiostoma belcheri]|nr:hypothetical protein Bbelb_085060 [Branchiostoma belcheri]
MGCCVNQHLGGRCRAKPRRDQEAGDAHGRAGPTPETSGPRQAGHDERRQRACFCRAAGEEGCRQGPELGWERPGDIGQGSGEDAGRSDGGQNQEPDRDSEWAGVVWDLRMPCTL